MKLGVVWHHSQRNGIQVRKAQRMIAVWGPESMLRTPSAPLGILAIILLTVKSLLQPSAPAKSNLTHAHPEMAF